MREPRPCWLAGAAVVVAMLAGGCAAIPSSGAPQSTPTPQAPGDGAGADCCGMFLRAPQPGWKPQEVVNGFLQASAFFAGDHARARQYMTRAASQSWQPRSAVTILKSTHVVITSPHQVTRPGGTTTVTVTGDVLATLTSSGQYQEAQPSQPAREEFTLEPVNGRYLIDGLPSASPRKPSHELLLTSSLFHLVYTPRNLYFYGDRNQALTPQAVFVPTEFGNQATTLISDLLHGPAGWLGSAATTAFPAGARLAKPLQVLPGPSGGKTAIVDIGLPRRASSSQEQAMAAQLVATLSNSAYGRPLFGAVKLRFNGQAWPRSSSPPLHLSGLPRGIPHWRSNAAVYYLTPGGGPRVMGRLAERGSPLPGEQGSLSQLAVAPGGQYIAGIAGPASTVYTSPLAAGSAAKGSEHPAGLHLREQLSGASFTSLSWDSENCLWVVGRLHHNPGVWVLPSGRGPRVRVHLLSGVTSVTSLRVAPDGTRVAMIVGTGSSARLVLGAVVHDSAGFFIPQVVPLSPELAGVTALTWYDEDHLLVLTRGKSGGGLWNVPTSGDSAKQLTGQSGAVSITAAGPQNPLYLSLYSGQLEKSVGLGEPWSAITTGRSATYPG